MKLQIEDCRLKIAGSRCRMIPDVDCRITVVADDRIVSDAEQTDAA
jgi:hypothetical protein